MKFVLSLDFILHTAIVDESGDFPNVHSNDAGDLRRGAKPGARLSRKLSNLKTFQKFEYGTAEDDVNLAVSIGNIK